MPDYRRMYDDKEHLYAYDLPQGRDVVVVIDHCEAGEIAGEKGRKSKKPMLVFKGEKKKLALNKTNGKTIAKLYGKDTENWAGKTIALYATTTDFGGETVDCIRVRPNVPQPQRNNGNRQQQPQNGRGPQQQRTSAPQQQDAPTAQNDPDADLDVGSVTSSTDGDSTEGGDVSAQ